MGSDAIFDGRNWSAIPFHFWTFVFFVFGSMTGSFLNVVIHRLPLNLSVVSPPSHCPHCKYSIPWYLNLPLITWLFLRGKCRNCGARISVRYFIVELLTGIAFAACWMEFGGVNGSITPQSVGIAIAGSVLIAGLIAATFIDFEHFIIPDEITIGGAIAGLFFSVLVPELHGDATAGRGFLSGLIGIGVGAGVIYAIVRIGKLAFGRRRLQWPEQTRIIFTETSVHLPDEEIPFEDLFYRRSDVVVMKTRRLELPDRCYTDVEVRLTPDKLTIDGGNGESGLHVELNPEKVPHMEALTAELVLPREAMGFGDVKFMAAIGAFLGWQAVIFSLVVSSMVGAIVGLALIAVGRKEWGARLPYGPYIALAAVIWMFGGKAWWAWFQNSLAPAQ